MENGSENGALKTKAARTLKWNTLDRFSSQALYAVTGIVLANVLSKEDFGLVGVMLVFQAFALLLVDSGFGSALLQKKGPTQEDYSTVFWFNLLVATVVYWVLWICAPLIARLFHSESLIWLSRVMFLSFFINGLSIVQTNRLMKLMDVKQIAISDIVGLAVSGGAGIWIALAGFGAWAIVWQTVILAAVRSVWLWIAGKWLPSFCFRKDSFRHIWRIGIGVLTSSFLNTLCLNLYSFIIGAWFKLTSLGIYTQADKWSKMGIASLSQIFTSTFVPVLSGFQSDIRKFSEMSGKLLRISSFLLFPFMGGLIVMAEPIFHLLFGDKWDASIPLFQILCARGILLIITSVFNNFLLALGKAKLMVAIEAVKDILLVGALLATIGYGTLEALVWGQLFSALATFVIVLAITAAAIHRNALRLIADMAPYALLTAACAFIMHLAGQTAYAPWLALIIESAIGIAAYCGILRVAGSAVMREATAYLRHRKI